MNKTYSFRITYINHQGATVTRTVTARHEFEARQLIPDAAMILAIINQDL